MTEIAYCIGRHFNPKVKSLYLMRQKGSLIGHIARFTSVEAAEIFAREFDFPLSDETIAYIEKEKNE